MENKRYDSDFLLKHTVAPLLVREDNGQFLRMSDVSSGNPSLTADTVIATPRTEDPYAVWDEATGTFGSVDEAIQPALSGTFDFAGLTVRTAFDMLWEEVDQ